MEEKEPRLGAPEPSLREAVDSPIHVPLVGLASQVPGTDTFEKGSEQADFGEATLFLSDGKLEMGLLSRIFCRSATKLSHRKPSFVIFLVVLALPLT